MSVRPTGSFVYNCVFDAPGFAVLSAGPGLSVTLQTRMNSIIVGPVYPYRGGISNYTRQLALGFISAGHAARVISFARQYPSFLYPGKTDLDPSPRPAELPDSDFVLDPLAPHTWRRTSRRIVEASPGVVCINWWTSYWALPFSHLVRACLGAGINTVLIVHNVYPHEASAIDRLLAGRTLRNARKFLTHSEIEAEKLRALITDGSKITLHPLPPFDHPGSGDTFDVRQALSIGLDERILLFFGFIRAYKGLSLLLEALAILRAALVTPKLIIAGEFWEPKAAYLEQIARHGLESQVLLMEGYISDDRIGALFRAVDVLVAPHLRGTQSGAVALAQGFGLPVVASASIATGITSVADYPLSVFETGNAADLARAIEKQLAAPGNRTPLSTTPYWAELARFLAAL